MSENSTLIPFTLNYMITIIIIIKYLQGQSTNMKRRGIQEGHNMSIHEGKGVFVNFIVQAQDGVDLDGVVVALVPSCYCLLSVLLSLLLLLRMKEKEN